MATYGNFNLIFSAWPALLEYHAAEKWQRKRQRAGEQVAER